MKVNKELVKVVGLGAYRIGKDIVYEGTKVVAIKSATSMLGHLVSGGVGAVKNMTLNDHIGDYNRKFRKLDKKYEKAKKREVGRVLGTISDDEPLVIEDIVNDVDIHYNADKAELIKDLGLVDEYVKYRINKNPKNKEKVLELFNTEVTDGAVGED